MQKKNGHVDCHHCNARFKSVFCGLADDELTQINEGKNCATHKKGSIVFSEGNFPHGLFCINSGKVKIAHTGDEGREQIIRFAKEGDIIGYRALLGGDKYSGTATALDDASICFIPKEIFFGILTKDASLSMEIMKLLSSDLRNAEHKITDLAQKPVRERMAEALLFLKETYGLEEDNATINVGLTREEIANIVGTATETCIRLLSEFKNDGILELSGKKIRIMDLNKLIKTANIND